MRNLTLILAFTGFASPTFARDVPDWPVDKLLKESDVVVIAVANATDDTKDSVRGDADLIGQNSTFTVRSPLKGKVKATQKIIVLHFRLQKGVVRKDSPNLVAFKDNQLRNDSCDPGVQLGLLLNVPEYLIYLRVRPDGRYEPVSGHYDSALSVRELGIPTGRTSGGAAAPKLAASDVDTVQSLRRELDLIVQRQALVAEKIAILHGSKLGGPLVELGLDEFDWPAEILALDLKLFGPLEK